VFIEAWIEKNDDKKYLIRGRMVTEDDLLIAEANGIFIKIPIEKITEYQDYYTKFRTDLDQEKT
jgi:hypothetical protein